MKPPICAIYFIGFRGSISEGGLVRFKLSDAKLSTINVLSNLSLLVIRLGRNGFAVIIMNGKKYKHLTVSDAIKSIKEQR